MDKHRLEIKILGRVQGVMFRSSAHDVAKSLHITGYAKNLPDGSVEIIAEGEENALSRFSKWCTRGPFFAEVKGLHIEWKEYVGEYKDFTVEREGNFLNDQYTILKRTFFEKQDMVVPKHVAIICDGNRRWAQARGLLATEGHKAGYENLDTILASAKKYGVKHLTLWVFSTENWKRSKSEVEALMSLFSSAFAKAEELFKKHEIRFNHIGRKDRLSPSLKKAIKHLEDITKDYQQFNLGIALDYGGRDEIIRGIEKAKENSTLNITEENFSENLDTFKMPDPDLVIRTSGEQRLSGFMPWQTTYSELYFSDAHFPEFSEGDFLMALLDYSFRKRRFGA